MILDTHTHFYDPSRPQGVPWPPASEAWLYRTVLPSHYRALAEPLGIGGTVVVEASPWVEDNQWLLDLARQDSFLCGIVGNLDPAQDSFRDRLERFSRDRLFRGIRCGAAAFAGGADGLPAKRLGLLADLGLTLEVHAGTPELPAVAGLARRFPGLSIVIDHLGLVPIDGGDPPADWLGGMRQAAEQPGVSVKVSAFQELCRAQPAPPDLAYYEPVFSAVWDAFGPDRLLYGSNWPVCDRGGTLAAGLGLLCEYIGVRDPGAAPAILSGNACRVYGLRPRAVRLPGCAADGPCTPPQCS